MMSKEHTSPESETFQEEDKEREVVESIDKDKKRASEESDADLSFESESEEEQKDETQKTWREKIREYASSVVSEQFLQDLERNPLEALAGKVGFGAQVARWRIHKLQGKIEQKEQEIRSIEAGKGGDQEALENLRAVMGRENPELADKLKAEEVTAQERKEDLDAEIESLKEKIASKESLRERFEKRTKEALEESRDQLDKQLPPLEQKLAAIEARKVELGANIHAYDASLAEFVRITGELQIAIDNTQDEKLKALYNGQIRELKKSIDEGRKILARAEKQLSGIIGESVAISEKIRPLRLKRRKLGSEVGSSFEAPATPIRRRGSALNFNEKILAKLPGTEPKEMRIYELAEAARKPNESIVQTYQRIIKKMREAEARKEGELRAKEVPMREGIPEGIVWLDEELEEAA